MAEADGLVADDGPRQCRATICSGLSKGLLQPVDLDADDWPPRGRPAKRLGTSRKEQARAQQAGRSLTADPRVRLRVRLRFARRFTNADGGWDVALYRQPAHLAIRTTATP
jgi:hypothetical protein